jgi:hypothetical protein
MISLTKIGIALLALTSAAGALAFTAQDKQDKPKAKDTKAMEMPEMPPPVKEHQWLQQFVGEWTFEMGPDQPAMKMTGTETVRSLGGFWTLGEGKCEMMGQKMSTVLTLGYDVQKKRYVGTWVDSMTSTLWNYTGSVDAAGKVLTLDTEGPDFTNPGKTCKFREVIELKAKNHKTFSSSMQGEDGKWTTFMTANYRRKE